jgi:molybdopterin converting factor subunit 1
LFAIYPGDLPAPRGRRDTRTMTTVAHTVLLFAGLRERSGRAQVVLDVPPGATLAAIVEALAHALPAIASALPHCRVAVAQEFVDLDHVPAPGDEIAIIPPVSGGHDGARIQLGLAPLSLDAAIASINSIEHGGIATFSGHVRRHSRGRTIAWLEYEAYEPMALRVLERIADQVTAEIPGSVLAIHHRLGRLELGEAAVVIAAAAAHRAEAFAACRVAIEALKRDVPIWKREVADDGAVWIGLGP